MRKIILITIIITSTLFLNSCYVTSAIGTIIMASNDRRTAGEILDDKNILFSLLTWRSSEEDKKILSANLNYMVYDTEVLVTGEVPNEDVQNYIAAQILLKDFKISKVINELRIAPNSDMLNRAKDSIITAQVKALFFNQEVFNPMHVKITTENRTIYLMGKMTSREAAKATKIASKVNGVERIIKLFHYLKTRPASEIQREKEKEAQAEKKAALVKDRKIIKAKKAELRHQIRTIELNDGTSFSLDEMNNDADF